MVERSPGRRSGGHDRLRAGLNHLAFHVGDRSEVDDLVAEAPRHGWRLLFADRHPHAGGPHHYAGYLENDQGFEVEPVVGTHGRPASTVTGVTTPSDRPFRILGLQQIAIGGPDLGPLRHFWNDLLGVEKVGDFSSESENVVEDILRLGTGPTAVEVDLMQPHDPEARPRVDSPPLNHLGLWVDDLAAAVEWLTAQGVRFTPGGIRTGAAGHDVCFIHPRGDDEHPHGGQGVLIELVQAPEVVAASLAP